MKVIPSIHHTWLLDLTHGLVIADRTLYRCCVRHDRRRNEEERARIEAQHIEQQRVNREAEQLIRVGKVTAVELGAR